MKKTILKSILYRIWSVLLTSTIVFLVTGNPQITTTITIILEVFKTINYFVFENIWKYVKTKRNELQKTS